MAIGTAAAIGLGVAGIGSAVSASSSRSAANRAAAASEQNNAANVALQREIYNQNRGIISPFVNRGNAAGDAINALLGLGGQNMGGPAAASIQPNALSQFLPQNGGAGFNPAAFGDAGLPYGLGDGFITTGTMDGGVATATGPTTTQPPTQITPQQAAANAFDIFRDSTGYQFRVNEAQNALNSGFAGSGLLQSGAALRSLDELRQNMASAEFSNYLGQLGQQQAVGAGSASSLAGVGQNFASNVAQLNTINANNQANAAIARGQNNPLANFLGVIGGGALGAFG